MRRIRPGTRDPKNENPFFNIYSFIPDEHVNESIDCIRRILTLSRRLHVDRIETGSIEPAYKIRLNYLCSNINR